MKIRSFGALLLAAFFATVTARTIFDDVWHGTEVTVAHLQSLAAIVAALASGHLLWPTARRGLVPQALGLLIVFVAATGYVVISAGARNAELSEAKAVAAASNAEAIEGAKAKVAEAVEEERAAKKAAAEATKAAAKECASGKGKRCDGTIETRKAAEKATGYRIMAEVQLNALKPAPPANAGYQQAAKVLEALGVGAAAEIERRIELLLPFAVVAISEIGTLVFGSLALGHAPAPGGVVVPDSPARDGRRSAGGQGVGSQKPERPLADSTASSAADSGKVATSVEIVSRGRRGRPVISGGLDDAISRYGTLHGRRPTISELERLVRGASRSSAARALRRAAI